MQIWDYLGVFFFISVCNIVAVKREEINIADEFGLELTLNRMKLIELENSLNHFFRDFCFRTFSNNSTPEALYRKIHSYVTKNFTYQDDPGDEQLTAPKYLVDIKRGDCDDFSLFIKTVLTVLGVESNYLICAETEGEYTHIAVKTTDGFILDGTNDKFNFLDSEKYKHQAIVVL